MHSAVIKENTVFRRMYYRAKSSVSPILVTYVMKRRGGTRYGITVGKKIGNSVQRNRAKRIIRAAFSQLEGSLNGSYDIIFVARTKTVSAKSTEVAAVMREQLQELNAVKGRQS